MKKIWAAIIKTIRQDFTNKYFWRYMLVIVLSVFLIAAAIIMPKPKKKEKIEASTEATVESTEESTQETTAKKQSRSVSKTEILQSHYQYVNNYTWQQLYALIICCSQTNVDIEGHAGFSLIKVSDDFDPLLLIGKFNPETNVATMTLYITDNGYVYELLPVSGVFYVDAQDKTFYINNADIGYEYSPHVLLQKTYADQKDIQSVAELVPIVDAEKIQVLSEDIEKYIWDISEVTE